MTSMYRTGGSLKQAVTDLQAARAYLDEPMEDFVKYSELADPTVVFTIRWDLVDEETWQVVVITTRPLTAEESATLSEWISGQNSDGLGEGFEQQAFAEQGGRNQWGDYEDAEDEDGNILMASFDWETNPCTLELLK